MGNGCGGRLGHVFTGLGVGGLSQCGSRRQNKSKAKGKSNRVLHGLTSFQKLISWRGSRSRGRRGDRTCCMAELASIKGLIRFERCLSQALEVFGGEAE